MSGILPFPHYEYSVRYRKGTSKSGSKVTWVEWLVKSGLLRHNLKLTFLYCGCSPNSIPKRVQTVIIVSTAFNVHQFAAQRLITQSSSMGE